MTFPPSPTNGQTHTEGGKDYVYNAATPAWERAAAAAQTAASTSVAPAGNLAATDVQAALLELQADIDGLASVTGSFVGLVSTSAGLDALTDVDGTAAIEDGDIAYLDADDGGREAGFYLRAGGVWPPAPFHQLPDSFVAGSAILSDTLAGVAGVAATYARADHRHAQSRGDTLPPQDGSGGAVHILDGHATAPDGLYSLIGGEWVEA